MKMRKPPIGLIIFCIVINLFFSFLLPGNAMGQEKIPSVYGLGLPEPESINNAAKPGNVYIVTVNRLTMLDILNNKELFNRIINNGAVGLMSSSVEGSNNPDSNFASIGAGAPINATGSGAWGVNAGESINGIPAQDVYRQRTGLAAPENSVLQLDIARLKRLNQNNRYSAVPGYLGTLLRKNGFGVQVLGNADTIDSRYRHAVGLAMDRTGIIPAGDVGEGMVLQDNTFPGGIHTDYARLLDLTLTANNNSGLTVVELGDLERLERLGAHLEANILQAQREKTIKRIAAFIDSLLIRMDKHDLLVVVSPTPRGNYLPDTNYLTPVLISGNGVDTGILTSPTTRRPGIIKNTDLAPSILNYYSVPMPPLMYGRPIQLIAVDNPVDRLSALYEELELIYQARPPVLRNYVLIQLILVILSLAAILAPGRNYLMPVLKPLLLAVMSVPVSLLLLPLLPHASLTSLVIELVAITAGIVTALHLWLKQSQNELDPFIIISLFTALCIVVDLLLGAPLQKNSLLGYDPIVGARYYGIGNEYMGVLLGSTIIGTTAMLTRLSGKTKKILWPVGIYYITTLYIIAAPQLGTNVGGSIAGAGSFMVTFLLLWGVRFNLKTLLKIAATVLFFLLTISIYDMQRPLESQSHIGRTVHLILQGGPAEIFNITARKFNMNIKLIKYTIWSRIFLASLASLAILFYRPVGVMQQISCQYACMYKGFIGVVTASVLALIFNDSGIVAAATAMIFGAPPLLYLVIRAQRLGHGK